MNWDSSEQTDWLGYYADIFLLYRVSWASPPTLCWRMALLDWPRPQQLRQLSRCADICAPASCQEPRTFFFNMAVNMCDKAGSTSCKRC